MIQNRTKIILRQYCVERGFIVIFRNTTCTFLTIFNLKFYDSLNSLCSLLNQALTEHSIDHKYMYAQNHQFLLRLKRGIRKQNSFPLHIY